MNITDPSIQLLEHGIKPTSNRVLVFRILLNSNRPLSIHEINDKIPTLDKSSIFRVLTLFKSNHLVHVVNADETASYYELCLSHNEETDDDVHVHFLCEKCGKLYCIREIKPFMPELPDGFSPYSVSMVIKGVCPFCY